MIDEIRGEALLGLVESARRYDPGIGVKFSTFASKRIKGRIKDFFRKFYSDKYNFVARLSDLEIDDQEKALSDVDTSSKNVEDIDSFENIIRHIPPQHKEVCRLVFLENMTNKKAAKMMNLSESRVAFIRIEAKGMLKEMYESARSESSRSVVDARLPAKEEVI